MAGPKREREIIHISSSESEAEEEEEEEEDEGEEEEEEEEEEGEGSQGDVEQLSSEEEEDDNEDDADDEGDMLDEEEEEGEPQDRKFAAATGSASTTIKSRRKIKPFLKSNNDQNQYEEALRLIADRQIDLLELEHCKSYLRFHSLRISGKKELLLQRIKEHIELKDGGGMTKYPRSTFRINCKGDIVLFEQNVYESYDKVSRSSLLPPLGKRIIAGRIVKESYGSKKQQHTFTIEVLWSRGPKALPPLYPLLIKGRNLYRLKTFRQPWPNEADRKRALQEKHFRGSASRVARSDRLERKQHLKTSTPGKAKQRSKKNIAQNMAACAETHSRMHVTRGTNQTVGSVASSSRKRKTVWNDKKFETLTMRQGNCSLKMPVSSLGLIIGKQGNNIKRIRTESGAHVTVSNSGMVEISGKGEQIKRAREMIQEASSANHIPTQGALVPTNVLIDHRTSRMNCYAERSRERHGHGVRDSYTGRAFSMNHKAQNFGEADGLGARHPYIGQVFSRNHQAHGFSLGDPHFTYMPYSSFCHGQYDPQAHFNWR